MPSNIFTCEPPISSHAIQHFYLWTFHFSTYHPVFLLVNLSFLHNPSNIFTCEPSISSHNIQFLYLWTCHFSTCQPIFLLVNLQFLHNPSSVFTICSHAIQYIYTWTCQITGNLWVWQTVAASGTGPASLPALWHWAKLWQSTEARGGLEEILERDKWKSQPSDCAGLVLEWIRQGKALQQIMIEHVAKKTCLSQVKKTSILNHSQMHVNTYFA